MTAEAEEIGTIENPSTICTDFQGKKYSQKEFQSRLETLLITDNLKLDLEKTINDALIDLKK